MEIKTDRRKINDTNEKLLNEMLWNRGVSKNYCFGIAEEIGRDYWNLALYKTDGVFGEKIQQIYGIAISSNKDYEGTITAIVKTQREIEYGLYDYLDYDNYEGVK